MYADESLRNDKKFIINALKHCNWGTFFEFVGDELKKQRSSSSSGKAMGNGLTICK